jgi:ethanolamine ammonia-lyase large subunit
LRGENESLSELPVRLRLVGDFTDDLDNNVDVGSLGVDVGDANLAVLEFELLYPVVDGLESVSQLSRMIKDLKRLTLWPTQTCTLSVSFPDTNWERLL